MYQNAKTGQIISDDEAENIVSSWIESSHDGITRPNILGALKEAGFEYIEGNPLDEE